MFAARSLLALPSILLLASGCADAPGKADPSESTIDSWSVSSGFDSAGVVMLTQVEVLTPAAAEVDLMVEAEVAFATSGGDFGRVRASLYPEERTEEGALQPIRMFPKAGYDLGSPGLPPEESSLSATWELEDVPAEGRAYTVELWGVAIDGDEDFQAEIGGEGGWARVKISP